MSNTFDNRYFYANKFFLTCIGHWPFHNAKRNLAIQGFIILHLLISFVTKATNFFKTCKNLEKIMECIPTIFLGITSLCFSVMFFFNQDKLCKLYREIKFDWECLSSKQEKFIISKHAKRGSLLTILFTGCFIGSIMTYGIMSNLQILHFLPFNESQFREFTFQMYYVNYSGKYFYWSIIHLGFNTILESVIFISFESILAVSIEHACGLFEKIGLHLEKINCNHSELEKLKAVVYCVLQHNRAIQFVYLKVLLIKRKLFLDFKKFRRASLMELFIRFCDSIKSLYWPYFLWIMMLKRCFISVSFVQVLSHSNNFIVTVKYCVFVGSLIGYIFYNTLFLQRIMDYSTDLTDNVYNTLWYQMPLRIKKNLLLIMIRSRIPCNISVVKLINISLEFLLTSRILKYQLDATNNFE